MFGCENLEPSRDKRAINCIDGRLNLIAEVFKYVMALIYSRLAVRQLDAC